METNGSFSSVIINKSISPPLAESSTREPNKKTSAFGVDSRIRLLIVEEMAGDNLIVFKFLLNKLC
jgi:hypothetical protein